WDDFRRLPGGTGPVVRRMLAVDPNERPRSMAEVILLLESPPRPTRRAALVTGAAVVVALSGGALAYFRPWQREPPPPKPKPELPGYSPEQLATAAENNLPVEWTDEYGITFVLIPPGQAWVGTAPEEIDRLVEREPDPAYHPFIRAEVRRVINIPKPAYLARTELTIGQMKAIVGPRRFISEVEAGRQNGYAFRDGQWVTEPGRSWRDGGPELPLTDDHPAINLTYLDASNLVRMMNGPAKGVPRYLVPDEEFWEYACLAGSAPTDANGNPVAVEDIAVFDTPRPLPVRSRLPNRWGLFDMLGNLLEWCLFARQGGKGDARLAPLRGGKFNDRADRVRPAARVWEPLTSPLGGLRLARTANLPARDHP
ncbi:MAG TPA: SUMF1/EgtB/PvdO family nonheme iron enzyme, partial [Gemmataceae bacterium]|nr:SUMF1/EgtB/PvdO family nonheme iron enzyme [Gemmataceae bacterium]